MADSIPKPQFRHSLEYEQNNERIRDIERLIGIGFAGNDDWRAKESFKRQLEYLKKKQTSLGQVDQKNYEVELLTWEIEKIEAERNEQFAAEIQRIFEHRPIMGLEV